MENPKKAPINKVILPIQRFIQKERSGGLVMGISVILALILANSPWHNQYFQFLEYKLGFFLMGNRICR